MEEETQDNKDTIIENGQENNETKTAETKEPTKEETNDTILKDKESSEKKSDFVLKDGKYLFAKGNKASKGINKRQQFSLKNDLIKSLKRIKKRDKIKYQNIIDSYWTEKGMRQFLMEQIDGKASQSISLGGNQGNPIRIIEVKPMEMAENEANK